MDALFVCFCFVINIMYTVIFYTLLVDFDGGYLQQHNLISIKLLIEVQSIQTWLRIYTAKNLMVKKMLKIQGTLPLLPVMS